MDAASLKLPSDQDISGRNLGQEELSLLKEVIESGVLTSTKGPMVPRFESEFAEMHGARFAVAIASGTAAIHAAIAAINPEPLSEIITTPITDMGAITPIIYQGCIPIFADIDPYSYNVTAATIEKRITPKTKAIIVTHLFGNPCEMKAIMALAKRCGLPVIEDCAQSFLATVDGQPVGTIGDIGAFSMQQGKHMTTGEGGVVLIANNAEIARSIRLFINKAWGYGDKNPDHYFMALNYRLSELQGAVAVAQLRKLKACVEKRQRAARQMDARLASIRGIRIPKPPAGATHVYWKYCLDVDTESLGFGVMELAVKLKESGIASAPRYIQKPAFRCQVLRDGVIFGKNHAPLMHASWWPSQNEDWWKREYPGSYQALSRILVLPWNEFYNPTHVDFIADKIEQAILSLSGQ